MPDFLWLGGAWAVALMAAAGASLAMVAAGQGRWAAIAGVGAGFYAGCAMMGEFPRWPPLEDRDRWLAVLLPLTMGVEIAAARLGPGKTAWLLRAGVAAAAAPILLYNTTYLADLAGPGSAEWSPVAAAGILASLAALLLAVWSAIAALPPRITETELAAELALVAAAAGITVMLSGYYRAGVLGLLLAGALAGSMAALWRRNEASHGGATGIGLVGIFAVLLMGHFFGSLPAGAALALWLTPLLGWLPEVAATRLGPRTRQVLRIMFIAVALLAIVFLAKSRFDAASAAHSHTAHK